jgi:putative phosphoribosyl transferase
VEVHVPFEGGSLEADLVLPGAAKAAVVFAHGSGSSRHSPRNTLVASVLNEAGIATLLADLLTPAEEQGALRFDIPLLARRLEAATQWVQTNAETSALPLGYFGASTGAAAALLAATGHRTSAVVSRGGRPDLAAGALPRVEAPTLLIAGERDPVVIELNRRALAKLRCEKQLEIVPNASHLFPEPGALERVAELARDWFLRYSS